MRSRPNARTFKIIADSIVSGTLEKELVDGTKRDSHRHQPYNDIVNATPMYN